MNELVSAVPWLGKRNPMAARWLIIIVALVAPIVALQFGRSWVRILDFALLYMMLALGLNLVVGFAGLLDLGYIAFYAVGAYTFAFLASPHFGVHLPFWLVLPLGAGFAALAGIMLGFPVLRLRGDYLAIGSLSANLDQTRGRALGARSRRDASGTGQKRPAQPRDLAGGRANAHRTGRGRGGTARRGGVWICHGTPGGNGLHFDAQVPAQHLPGGHRHAEP
jgi:hypothetical protein